MEVESQDDLKYACWHIGWWLCTKIDGRKLLNTLTLTKMKRSDFFDILVECFKLQNDLESINSHGFYILYSFHLSGNPSWWPSHAWYTIQWNQQSAWADARKQVLEMCHSHATVTGSNSCTWFLPYVTYLLFSPLINTSVLGFFALLVSW
jgi:hypothetical protein